MTADNEHRRKARVARLSATELRQLIAEAPDFDFDEMTIGALEAGIEAIESLSALNAEIGRLRGEVDARISPDWVIGYFPADVAEEVKRAVRDAFGEWNALSPKPAPAMPNRMEGLIDDLATALVMYNQSRITMQSLAGSVSDFLKSYHALRAADNRDAAGVDRQPDGYMAQWAADQLRSNKYVSCQLYNHQNKVIHGDGKEAVPFYFGLPTPAAVPAGEANADAPADVLEHLIFSVDRVANSGDYGLCDQAVVQLNLAIEDARKGIGTSTPKLTGGNAVAWQAQLAAAFKPGDTVLTSWGEGVVERVDDTWPGGGVWVRHTRGTPCFSAHNVKHAPHAARDKVRELLREAGDTVEASTVEDGISDNRRLYRIELAARIKAALAQPQSEEAS